MTNQDIKLLSIIYGASIILIGLVQALVQKFSRNSHVLGVYVGENIGDKNIQNYVKSYTRSTLGLASILALGQFLLGYKSSSIRPVTIYFFVGIFASYLPLIYYNKKIQDYVGKLNIEIDKKVLISTDLTRRRDDQNLRLAFYYGLSLLVIGLGTVFIITNYDKFPDKLIMQVGLDGSVNRYADKSYANLLQISLINLALLATIFLANIFYLKSKQRIDTSSPDKSKERLLLARKIWTRYFGILSLGFVTLIQVGVPSLMINGQSMFLTYGTILVVIISIVGSIVLGLKVGTDGSKLAGGQSSVYSEDDDNWYLGAMIYYNPNDAATFVHKRVGVGTTINLGTNLGKFIFFILVVILISSISFALVL